MTQMQEIAAKVRGGQRISDDECLYLYEHGDLASLQDLANEIRCKRHAEKAFYNRNIHFEPTNKCIYACKFCSFARKPKATEADGAWDYWIDEIKTKLDKYPADELSEVHITGGVHPERSVEDFKELVGFIKGYRPNIHIKAFTAVEITWMAKVSGLTVAEALAELKSVGLGSLPGGGAEIFNDEVRRKIAGGKAPANRWLEVHREAHLAGLASNATMLYGHVESYADRVDHMSRLRQLQDETSGFNAFIPLRYRNEDNKLSHLDEVSFEEDMKNYAIARIYLDNIAHLKAYWVMLGVENAFAALEYGVDDLDGTVDDSTKIYSMAGSMDNPTLSSDFLIDEIKKRGRCPIERDSLYRERGLL